MKKSARLFLLLSLVAILIAACSPSQEPSEAPQLTPPPAQATQPGLAFASATPEMEGQEVSSATGGATPEPTASDLQASPVPEVGPSTGSGLHLVFVQHALCAWDSYWCPVEAGIQQAAADMQANVTVLGPDQFDLDQVASLIDQAVSMQPSGLAVTLVDLELLREPVQRALDAGIPVVVYNSGAGPEVDGLDYLTYLGSLEQQAGYLAAIRLADAGGTRGVCINHQIGNAALDARCQAFVSAMDTYGLPAEVLAISDDPAASQQIIADYYAANPDTDAFLTLGPNGAHPFYAFMEGAGLGPGSLFHGTFDLSEEIAAHIKDGTTLYAVDQQPFYQGYGAVQALVLNLRYGITPVLEITPTGPNFVDAQSLDFVAEPNRPVALAAVQHALCTWDPFWCTVEAGMRQAAEDMSVDLTLQGPDQFDLDQMVQLVNQAAAAQPGGLAVTVPDVDRLRDSIQGVLDAGIPVVAYNAGAGPLVDNVEYLTYLGMDRFYENQGGYQAGLTLTEDGGTQAVCINHQLGQMSLDARCDGFQNAMTERGIPTEVLAITQDPAEAQALIADYYAANPDTNVFLTLGPSGALPFYAFLQAADLERGALKHGTFDLTEESVAHIKDGTTLLVIDQQPFWQGYGAVQTLMLKVRYGINPVLPVMPTGPVVIDAGNVDAVADLLGE